MNNKEEKKQIEIFPYILARIAGESFETLELLNMGKTFTFIIEIHKLSKAINAIKTTICDELYALIPLIKDSKAQNILVRIKRDIHNLRDFEGQGLDIIKKYASDSIIRNILTIEELKNKKNEMSRELAIVYNDEIEKVRLMMQDIIKKDNFKKGLLISSENLLRRTDSYSHKEIKSFNKDDYRTEQSLIKYVSRMCAKTSPFSTFTNLGFCELEETGFTGNNYIENIQYKEGNINSHVRLNGALFLYLKGLFFKNIKISRWFLLRPNPTAKIQNEEYVFLTNFDNIESFQKLEVNPVINVLLQLVSEKKEGIIFNELLDAILENGYIDASKEELENYVLTLIEYGLFEYNLNVSGIDPDWDFKLSEKLKIISNNYPLAGELSRVLSDMRNLAEQYSCSDYENRKRILNESFESFRNICMKLHKDAGLPEEEWSNKVSSPKPPKNEAGVIKPENEPELAEKEEFKSEYKTRFYFKPQQIYYEDTSVDCKLIISGEKIKGIISKYDELINAIKLFETSREEFIKMTYFFISKYGKEGSINVLTFYEEYFREYKKPEADKMELLKKNKEKDNVTEVTGHNDKNINETDVETRDAEEDIRALKEHRDKVKKWNESFKKLFHGQLGINPDNIAIDSIHLPEWDYIDLKENNSSHGLFLQFFTEAGANGEEKLKAVINSTPPGYGKFFSRFLHLFDKKITDEIIENNISFSKDDLFVENCDYSHFNANIHPPLMPYEVWLPGSQNSLDPEKQIMVTDINIIFDSSENCLKLLHNKLGKVIYVFDLGFQSTMARSKLFQILSMFTKAENIYPYSLVTKVNDMIMKESGLENIKQHNSVFTRPRIVYEDMVVLQRKQWIIPYKCIPYKLGKEADYEYFYRVNDWRTENNIPEEVFVLISYFKMFNEHKENKEKPKIKTVADDHKPQYINFKNPFLVNLFSKLCDKVSDAMRIDEMLPASKDLLKFDNKKYVTEYIVQWN